MTLTTADRLAAITQHSEGFARATRGDLGAPVEHCPGWSVADLVRHLTEVHWFWATIAEETPDTPPDDDRKPSRAPDAELVAVFETGAARLAEVLGAADQSASCWTWAVQQQDVGFITRHQVQEAAVHHWDAANATGAPWSVRPEVASDCVDEFLHLSVAADAHPEEWTSGEPLAGTFVLRTSDTGDAWTLSDGDRPGTVRVTRGDTGRPVLEATAADLILWLYGRREVDTSGVPDELLARFRALCFTD